jgi:hypothetical protein
MKLSTVEKSWIPERTITRVFLDISIVIDLIEGTPEQRNNLKARIAGKEGFSSEFVRMDDIDAKQEGLTRS